ncbi:MAG: hypothetical protein KF774_17115 [Planctomyces sp.]|nr:hypothetical protein [Planctomyces sp.]
MAEKKSTAHRSLSEPLPNAGETIALLQKAYRMEIETVANYLANSVHLDGIRAEEVKRSLAADVTEELGHARRLAERIKQLGGRVPGSLELQFDQESLRPPQSTTDVRSVVEGVLAAEEGAIAHYRDIIRATSDDDPVTADLCTQLLSDEDAHWSQFRGFLAELDSGH